MNVTNMAHAESARKHTKLFLAASLGCPCLQAVHSGCVPKLLMMVSEPSTSLACLAARALMMITTANEGKAAVSNLAY